MVRTAVPKTPREGTRPDKAFLQIQESYKPGASPDAYFNRLPGPRFRRYRVFTPS